MPLESEAPAFARELALAYESGAHGQFVLYGNVAKDGCIVKTAGVDESIWRFEGPARVFHSQEAACEAILENRIESGDVLVIVYEGPKGGPGMQEMLYPTSFLKGKGLGKACALITDGRFSGGTSGLRCSMPRARPSASQVSRESPESRTGSMPASSTCCTAGRAPGIRPSCRPTRPSSFPLSATKSTV